ncbi:NUDIX domain-containing protein [Pseudarcicella hirudinis]
MKEAEEETGLSDIKPVSEQIFDVDIHLIPERKGIPAHFHYDIRFLLEADKNAVLVVPEDESSELKWIKLEEVTHYNNSDSIVRMVEKSLK